jgi:hypothetical protein
VLVICKRGLHDDPVAEEDSVTTVTRTTEVDMVEIRSSGVKYE